MITDKAIIAPKRPSYTYDIILIALIVLWRLAMVKIKQIALLIIIPPNAIKRKAPPITAINAKANASPALWASMLLIVNEKRSDAVTALAIRNNDNITVEVILGLS